MTGMKAGGCHSVTRWKLILCNFAFIYISFFFLTKYQVTRAPPHIKRKHKMTLMCVWDTLLFLEAGWWILILISTLKCIWQHGLHGVCEMSFLPHFLIVSSVLHCTFLCTPGTGISLMRSFHPFFCRALCCRFHTWQSVRLGVLGVATFSWSEFCALSNKLTWSGIPSLPVAALHRELLKEKTATNDKPNARQAC